MVDIDLSQAEADALIAMEKYRVDEKEYDFPLSGQKVIIPLVSKDKREQFLLDIALGRIDLKKVKYMNRVRHIIILLRLELTGPKHCNPDGVWISCPHLHVFKEGFGDKWAIPLPESTYYNPDDIRVTLEDFMTHCNIIQPPIIRGGLFS